MTQDVTTIPNDQESLKQLVTSQMLEIDWLRRDNSRLEGMLRLAGLLRFGSKSEQMLHPGMRSLFPGEAASVDEAVEDKKARVSGHDRQINTRKPLPDHLPREDKLIDVANKSCSCCGTEMKKVSEDISEKLHYQPAVCTVHRYIRPVYSCQSCERMKAEPMPSHPIPKCSVTSDTIAQIAVSKYVDAMPLYRQEQIFARHRVEIGRDKMARWLISISDALVPLLKILDSKLSSGPIMQMDETYVQVLKEKNRPATSKSYMIVKTREGPPGQSIVTFHYNPSRSSQVLAGLVGNFQGILLTDGLEVYGSLCLGRPGVVHAGCWSHARRYFIDAQKQLKPSRREGSVASRGVILIDLLFKVEREAKDLTDNVRLAARQKDSKPTIDELRNLIDTEIVNFPKKSETGRALTYLYNQWPKLIRFLDDGHIPIHNNFTENRIRPFTVGRRNWLFSDTPEGATASAIIYSLLVTAQVNGLNPYEYFCRVLANIARPGVDLEALLPFTIHQ